MNTGFELERAERLLKDIRALIYSKPVCVSSFRIKNGAQADAYREDLHEWQVSPSGSVWIGHDQYRWYQTKILIPDTYNHHFVVFQLSTGREGQWDATNPQMLLYVGQKLMQGMDVNHSRFLLTNNAVSGTEYEIAFLAYSGTAGAELVIEARTAILNEEIEALYYDLSNPIEAARLLQKTDPESNRIILKKMTPALDVLDLHMLYSKSFDQSVERARKSLRMEFYTQVRENGPVVSGIGHTHIDVAWLWSVEQTKAKVIRSFATVLKLMEDYPDYKFMSSQPILYQFVKESNPSMYQQIKDRIKEGRWEIDGAMWLEPDCNLPCGESLVRQLLKGHVFMEKEFGIGFDAGGSDRKVSAVIKGTPVYSEEVVWYPKTTADPGYHYNEIVTAFHTAASHMPRVDAIGVSSAGVYVDITIPPDSQRPFRGESKRHLYSCRKRDRRCTNRRSKRR